MPYHNILVLHVIQLGERAFDLGAKRVHTGGMEIDAPDELESWAERVCAQLGITQEKLRERSVHQYLQEHAPDLQPLADLPAKPGDQSGNN
jgi:hypothetical protein